MDLCCGWMMTLVVHWWLYIPGIYLDFEPEVFKHMTCALILCVCVCVRSCMHVCVCVPACVWQTWGQTPSDLALFSISRMVFFLESVRSLDTRTGWRQRTHPTSGSTHTQTHTQTHTHAYTHTHIHTESDWLGHSFMLKGSNTYYFLIWTLFVDKKEEALTMMTY